jgi:AraC-like DNA-binding protein
VRLRNIFALSLLIVAPISVIVSVVYLSNVKQLDVFPSQDFIDMGIWSYEDQDHARIVRYIQDSRKILLSYVIKDENGFVGIGFNMNIGRPYTDLSVYDTLSLKVSSIHASELAVTLKTFEDGITNTDDTRSFRHEGTEFLLGPTLKPITIDLSKLADPSWWIKIYSPDKKSLARSARDKTQWLLIESHSNSVVGAEDTIVVEQVTFLRSNTLLITGVILFAILYYVILICVVVIRKIRRPTTNNSVTSFHIDHVHIDMGNYKSEELGRILNLLKSDYADPELNIGSLGKETGISPSRVSHILKSSLRTTFKRLLNSIRIDEAKRLLATTDRQITEIAFAVGYNDRAYFYRIFMKFTGEAPTEFRKKRIDKMTHPNDVLNS